MHLKSKLSLVLLAAGFTFPAQAVILYRSATRNTTAPTGTYLNSGWQYEMNVGGYLGTPIGPRAFLIANHIAPNTGFTFNWNSTTYQVTGGFTVPGTDIALRTVNATFPSFAALYNPSTDGSLFNKQLVIFGKGTPRGNEVNLTTAPRAGESTLRGWEWGIGDGVQSWGTNTISGFAYDDSGDSNEYFVHNFSRSGTAEEATVSAGDSGGGNFVKASDGVWKLAGVTNGVEFTFGLTSPGNQLSAAIFDKGNLYQYANNQTYFSADTVADQPANSYVNNVTNYLTQFASYVPKPGDATLDGKVNALDFNLIAGNFGLSTFDWAAGDFNHDGVVNSIDFNLFKANYGYVGAPPLGFPAASPSVVPEPAAGAAVILSTLAVLRRKRRGPA